MLEKEKRNKELKLNLTESLNSDFERLAKSRNRTTADQGHIVMRYYAYGHLSGKLGVDSPVLSSNIEDRNHEITIKVSSNTLKVLEMIAAHDGIDSNKVSEKAIDEYCHGHLFRLNHAEEIYKKTLKD